MLPQIKAKYQAKAVSCGFGTAESSGNTQIGITFEIVNHPEFAGETITWLGHFTDKTSERTIESLQYMGWRGDDLSELDNLGPEQCAALLPSAVQIVCEPDTYKDKTTLKVQWVNQIGGGSFAFKAPVTGKDLKAFAAQMRGAVRSAQASGPKGPSKVVSNGAGADKDKDAPF